MHVWLWTQLYTCTDLCSIMVIRYEFYSSTGRRLIEDFLVPVYPITLALQLYFISIFFLPSFLSFLSVPLYNLRRLWGLYGSFQQQRCVVMSIFVTINQSVLMLSSNLTLFCSDLFSSIGILSKAVVLPKAISFHLISYISCLNIMVVELCERRKSTQQKAARSNGI